MTALGRLVTPIIFYQFGVRMAKVRTWQIGRRYNEIRALHSAMKRQLPNTKFPKFPASDTLGPPLARFVEERREALQAYMRAVVKIPEHGHAKGRNSCYFWRTRQSLCPCGALLGALRQGTRTRDGTEVLKIYSRVALQSFGTKCKLLQRCSSSRVSRNRTL